MMLGTAGFTALLCSFAVKAKEETELTKMEFDLLLKGILVGNSCVGKSCLLRQLTRQVFDPCQDLTIGIDYATDPQVEDLLRRAEAEGAVAGEAVGGAPLLVGVRHALYEGPCGAERLSLKRKRD